MIEKCEFSSVRLSCNVITARIKALDMAYRDSIGIDFYRQITDGRITAVFGGMDSSYTLTVFEGADFGELKSFFSLSSATVFCFADTADRLCAKETAVSRLYEFCGDISLNSDDAHGKMSDVYLKLKQGEDGDINMPPFEFWYTDFCVRFNHSAAEYALLENAVAVAGFMTDEATLITGVATETDRRGKGVGSRALQQLLSNIKKKYPHSRVFAATCNADEFYIKNGFAEVGKVAVCEFRSI